MRTSSDKVNAQGLVVDGYDYALQVWVVRGVIQPCSHPIRMRRLGPCCNQNKYSGLRIGDVSSHEVR